MTFTHLHVHSQYSILDGAASIPGLVEKAKADGMTAVALTDHGNMFGVKLFYDICKKTGIKPIIGVEAYVARVSLHDKEKTVDRSGEHLIILAKNMCGYKNLMKLCSIGHVEGFYYRPRIDKEVLAAHSEGLIVSSACLGGEICQKIMAGKIEEAEATALWFKNIFGADYYLEIMRHPPIAGYQIPDVYEHQIICNEEILRMGEKLGIKVIATNDSHFLNAEDAEAHDMLLCINTRKDIDDPTRMRYTRQEWFKTTEEMQTLFADVPQVLENTREITDKIEEYNLNSDPIMPIFPIPTAFGSEEEYAEKFKEEQLIEEFGKEQYKKLGGEYDKLLRIKFESDYLEYLSWEGAKKRYGETLSQDIEERIKFELETIKKMGFPGYFLIVQDFISNARKMDVIVGPGRGSAAGSAVAYALGITNIDPIKYDLLFERFLNPDRISMPDIDIDFDDNGRQKVLDWVTDKYGQEKVAHIVTFGTMAAKMAIKDVARVLKLDLSESNRLAKMVPETPKITLKKAYKENPDLEKEKESTNPLIRKTLQLAEVLEGSVRQTGVHACGVLISRDPLTDHIPVMATEGESLLSTQYDGHFVEPIGLLKMDFLGLRTLSIIKTCLDNIKKSKNIDIDIDSIPLDDKETFALFSRGETTGLFQFESPGMKKHLRSLQPTRFEDLVAMNALYRPGPMEYIPLFINRKLGKEKIEYDHPMMEEYLKDTYGITVYQEQVMLLSRSLANFTRGMSDSLRKAMGKKKKEEMDILKEKFFEGCEQNEEFVKGCREKNKDVRQLAEKIWGDWEAFASYAFNKSHSVCYAYVAYQTGYLKANHPAEFMAANLSNNLAQIDKVKTFMEECKRMGLNVLAPDVNESYLDFAVNSTGDIRFGLAAIKGIGEGAADKIIEERQKNGNYKNVYDFFERIDYKFVNKKALESLITGGGLDGFGYHRAQYFQLSDKATSKLEDLINYGQKKQKDSFTTSLFSDMEGYEVNTPDIPDCTRWSDLETSSKEKELIGIYLSSHPLDSYKFEINMICTPLSVLAENFNSMNGREVTVAGITTDMRTGRSQKGSDYGFLTLEDFNGKYEFAFFGEKYIQFRNYFIKETGIYIHGRIRQHKWKQSEVEFDILSIGLLSELGKRMINSITLEVDVNMITSENLQDIKKYLHSGKPSNEQEEVMSKPLRFVLHENGNNPVKMFSRTCCMECSKELYEYFENNDAIKMKIG
ncbi:MAG: DNA polymerase III subunit alpha [Culturomica sp.]|jgi:DNA polymerase-3 subunit alpha|nr:DNA polymerase III subunit alpha [Culturomica sp.]